MDLSESVVTCAVNLEWQTATGMTGRKLTYKIATLRLVRNDVREMYVEVSADKHKPTKLKLKDVTVHKKFMTEGKASIKFNAERCILFLSNAPPGPLIAFLRTLIIKLGGHAGENEAQVQKNLRAHLLSGKPSTFEDVSPVTTAEMIMARKAAGLVKKGTVTTPSPPQAKKRKFEELKADGRLPAPKKLYQSSPLVEEDIKLNDEQNGVLQACLTGKSIFFTGSAGTGKSLLLRKIISTLPPDGTVATASTGVAACLIGGTTLHNFAGIGGGDASLTRCIEMAARSAHIWRKCKRLIIDEISMVDSKYFDKIEAVARHVRRNDKPFGGIQLILCGDFFQLPPVIKREDFSSNGTPPEKRFCFQADSWDKCIQIVFELKQVHRQTDAEFVRILNHIRIGHITDEIADRLLATSRQKIESNGILATQLCSHTNDANAINESKLENLPGDRTVFRAEDSDPSMTKQLDSQLQVPGELVLKLGAQVMLLRNINVSAGLVNGARGVVSKFKDGVPVVKFKSNQEYVCKSEKFLIRAANGNIITRRQVPLKLAWAFSIHKSQGLTLDCVEMALSKVFEAGQAYVALSRAKSLDSIRVLDFDKKQVWANAEVLRFYKLFRRRIHDMTIIPLGEKNGRGGAKSSGANKESKLVKFKKSLMAKPLMTIS